MENNTLSILPTMQWINPRLITPHPKNPRYSDRSGRRSAIVQSMREHGFWPHHPLLVRPFGDGFQSIGGSTRLECSLVADLAEVFCSIQNLSDDEAIIRLAEDNLGDPLSWADRCVYIAENAVKDSKLGLSRVRLVQACTGRTGNTAEDAAKRWGQAGDLIRQMMVEQSVHLYGLLNSAKDLSRHLYEIYALPEYADREYLVGRLLTEALTVEQVRSIVGDVRRSRETPVFDQQFERSIENHALEPQRGCSAFDQRFENVIENHGSGLPLVVPDRAVPLSDAAVEVIETVLRVVPDPTPRKAAKPDYSAIELMSWELESVEERVELLENLIYKLFNFFGDRVPKAIVDEAIRLDVFAHKHQELQNAG